jgi:tripartite-type tricarboxylate transporter receptor subunit TctC
MGAAMLLAALSDFAHAQPADYPSQRINIVVGFAAGGPVDVIARIIADGLQRRWGQPVVVENRAGAGGNLAAAFVSKANADGHTLLFTATGIVINQSLYDNPGYSIRDLAPISIAAGNSLLFAVHPSNPARTLADFVAVHKTNSFTFGTAGVGSGVHITAEYFFKVLAKVDSIHTPYQGSPPAVSALLGNHINLVTVPQPDAAPQVRQGNLRALALSGARRSEVLPEVPTFGEQGYAGFVSQGWIGFFAPSKTHSAIVEKLNAAVNDILQTQETKSRLDAVGFVANRQSLPDTLSRVDQELANWAKMVDAIGLKIR